MEKTTKQEQMPILVEQINSIKALVEELSTTTQSIKNKINYLRVIEEKDTNAEKYPPNENSLLGELGTIKRSLNDVLQKNRDNNNNLGELVGF